EIKATLAKNGIENFSVMTVFNPAWTTDWLTEESKEKLRKYGIAPPGTLNATGLIAGDRQILCPRCGSENIQLVSQFGSTAGKAFSAGQDLSEAISPDGPAIERIVTEHYNPIILGIRNLEKPVICSVNGVAAGAGANIALACDVVVAGRSASFLQAFSKIGLI